ncbi:MAG: hypothetical protein OET90_08920, partial [Desulfuromonadales bacterium]|nr:hypothetical protein [Desulfuromonadales bacterium]
IMSAKAALMMNDFCLLRTMSSIRFVSPQRSIFPVSGTETNVSQSPREMQQFSIFSALKIRGAFASVNNYLIDRVSVASL